MREAMKRQLQFGQEKGDTMKSAAMCSVADSGRDRSTFSCLHCGQFRSRPIGFVLSRIRTLDRVRGVAGTAVDHTPAVTAAFEKPAFTSSIVHVCRSVKETGGFA